MLGSSKLRVKWIFWKHFTGHMTLISGLLVTKEKTSKKWNGEPHPPTAPPDQNSTWPMSSMPWAYNGLIFTGSSLKALRFSTQRSRIQREVVYAWWPSVWLLKSSWGTCKNANPSEQSRMSAKNRCSRKKLGGSSTIKSAVWLTHSLENGRKVRFCGLTDFQTKLHQQLTLHEMYLQIRFHIVPLYWKYYFQNWLYIWEYIWGKMTPLLCKKNKNPTFIFHNTFQVHAEHIYICP